MVIFFLKKKWNLMVRYNGDGAQCAREMGEEDGGSGKEGRGSVKEYLAAL